MDAKSTEIPVKNDKLLDYWQTQIREGVRYRQVYGRSKEWNVYKNAYRNFFSDRQVPVNIIYAIGRSLVPQVYFRNPRIGINPSKPGYTPHARVLERVDNYLVTELGIKNTLKSLVLDCYLMGRGFGIIGYDSEYGFNPSFAAQELEGEGTLTQFGSNEKRIEYNYNVSPGMPWFLRCSPSDFIVPWGTRTWESASWFAFRKMRPVRDVKEDPKYANTSELKGTFISNLDNSDTNQESRSGMQDTGTEWVELWQVHDQRTGFVYVLTLDHNKFLRKEFDELQIEGLPARVLGFNEDPDFFWWTPDARLIIAQQYEINEIRTMARAHRRVALLKILYDKGLVGKESLDKLLDGDVKAAVPIDVGPSGDIRKAVALFQSHVHPDLASAAREVREDVREIVGFSRNQMGSFEESSGRRTAHEAEIVRAASLIRIDERRDIMADLLTDVMRGVNQQIFKQWTGERVVDIVGEDGARYWIRFTGRELRGEFTYTVRPEEALPESQGTQRQEIMEFIKVAQAIPGFNIQYLVEAFAGRYNWVDTKMLFPSNDPGRSPEKAMLMTDFMRMQGSQTNRGNPALMEE